MHGTSGLYFRCSIRIFGQLQNIEDDVLFDKIDISFEYILISDVIATGFLTENLNKKLVALGTRIGYIGVIVDSSLSGSPVKQSFLDENKNCIISLYNYPIQRYFKASIKEELKKCNIIRINPYTYIPITLSLRETNYFDTVIFNSEISFDSTKNKIEITNRFLNTIDEESIRIGFLKFNNLIHPYFFDTDKILNNIDTNLLLETFNKIGNGALASEKIQLFFPRKSGIQHLNFDLLKEALSNYSIEEIEIERFSTKEGWKFPHNSNYLSKKISNGICLILDDGSCSGDSIVQMVDEISFNDAKEMILVCFIGRVTDHKREFFSRLSELKVKDGRKIPISFTL